MMDPIRRNMLATGAAATVVAAAPQVFAQAAAQGAPSMSIYERGPVRIRYTEAGAGVHRKALRLTATNFDRFWEAELHRLRGELLLLQAGNNPLGTGQGTAEVAGYFQQALAIARQKAVRVSSTIRFSARRRASSWMRTWSDACRALT